jgi:formylglycine-generating enzyme required for sulfatase activity
MRIAGWFVACLIFAGAMYASIDRLNHWYRKQWHDVLSMHDLPPLDRSHWPKSPAAWTSETKEVEVATPSGLRKTSITYQINTLGMRLVQIEPGTFRMGLPDATVVETHETAAWGGPMYTQHDVRLSRAYFIGAFEVTNKQYEEFDRDHRAKRPPYQRNNDSDNHPVYPVTWQQAQQFCRWLSEKEGRLYRLPTEAEWEYACRAGTTNRTYWGENFGDRTKANIGGVDKRPRHLHWSDDGYEYTAPVGSFPPNRWGLYDMIGNAWEWVADWYAPFTTNTVVDPTGPATGHCRVGKGGGFTSPVFRTTSAARDGDDPGDLKDPRGIRVVCEVE